jgi:epsilon-lactone hydrolase
MSKQQRDALDQLTRHAPLDLGGDVTEQRAISVDYWLARPDSPSTPPPTFR